MKITFIIIIIFFMFRDVPECSLFRVLSTPYFESPVALVWPGLPLAPDKPDPLYFSFNHSVISSSQDNKGTIPVSCGAHAVAPHWSLTPPKEQSAIVKLPLNFLHLIKHTRETEEERDLGPVPLSPMSKMAGQLILHHLNALASFGYCI